jgi:integrase
MHPDTQHLYRSRHGIWYYRWVLPSWLRSKHPAVPREIKRSTRTADIRHARAIARRLHRTFLVQYATDLDMDSPWPDLAGIRKFEVEVDSATGRVRVNAEPHELDAAMAAVERIQEMNLRQEEMIYLINARAAALIAEARTTSADVGAPGAVTSTSAATTSPTISRAFSDWAEDQVSDNVWSKETCIYTHEPSNRLFRELVGEPTVPREDRNPGCFPTVDLELARLTPARMAEFIKDFRRYPRQQGRRVGAKTAREVLQLGGEPQTQENFYKRLGHVRLFISFCVEKSWVDAQVLKEIDIVLAKDTARNRAKRRASKATADEVVSDGYLPFTDDELKLLFGPEFERHVQQHQSRAAATYWIPLISLYAGTRVAEASALEVSDFPVRQGVQCIRVIEHEPLYPGVGGSRMKTPNSRRAIPLHPQLVELGLLDYVKQRRQAGHRHLWDGLNWEDKSGYGRYPSSDFGKLAKTVGVHIKRRKVLHSFRSTCSQALDRAGMSAEHADRFLGHDVDNTRVTNYGRGPDGEAALPLELMHRQVVAMAFPIKLKPWVEVAPVLSRANRR